MFRTTLLILLIAITALVVWKFPSQTISPGDLLSGHEKIEENCMDCHEAAFGISGKKCLNCHPADQIGVVKTTGEKIERAEKSVLFHKNFPQSSCISCHTDHLGKKAVKSIRQFSHGLLTKAELDNCTSCHQNPKNSLHAKLTGNCQQCHSTENWSAATLNHDKYFRFDRKHKADCESCHPGNSFEKYSCYGCHEHTPAKMERKHRKEGIRDYENCAKCHPSGNEDEAERIWRSKNFRNTNSTPNAVFQGNPTDFKMNNDKKSQKKRGWFDNDDDDDDDDHDDDD